MMLFFNSALPTPQQSRKKATDFLISGAGVRPAFWYLGTFPIISHSFAPLGASPTKSQDL